MDLMALMLLIFLLVVAGVVFLAVKLASRNEPRSPVPEALSGRCYKSCTDSGRLARIAATHSSAVIVEVSTSRS
jgi:hypothetical protein